MSEQMAADATQNEPPKPTPPAQAADAETPKVDEVDWKAKAREWERRAKENKTAADELATIKEAQKSDAEKASERLAAAERDAAEAKRDALRFKIAAKFSITDEDADLFLTGADEDTLTKQAERLAARADEASKPRTPKPDPNQGRTADLGTSTADQFAAAFGSAFERM